LMVGLAERPTATRYRQRDDEQEGQ